MAPHWSQEGGDLVWRPNVAGERAGGRRARLEGTGGGGEAREQAAHSAVLPSQTVYYIQSHNSYKIILIWLAQILKINFSYKEAI